MSSERCNIAMVLLRFFPCFLTVKPLYAFHHLSMELPTYNGCKFV